MSIGPLREVGVGWFCCFPFFFSREKGKGGPYGATQFDPDVDVGRISGGAAGEADDAHAAVRAKKNCRARDQISRLFARGNFFFQKKKISKPQPKRKKRKEGGEQGKKREKKNLAFFSLFLFCEPC